VSVLQPPKKKTKEQIEAERAAAEAEAEAARKGRFGNQQWCALRQDTGVAARGWLRCSGCRGAAVLVRRSSRQDWSQPLVESVWPFIGGQ
jgi:hypothetical protein